MRLPVNGSKTHLPDNSPHVPSVTAGGTGGFLVWSPRPPARRPISFSAIGYDNPAYSLTARSGCPDDWVHRHPRSSKIVVETVDN
jgi:hypothetical protein